MFLLIFNIFSLDVFTFLHLLDSIFKVLLPLNWLQIKINYLPTSAALKTRQDTILGD